MDTIVPLGRRTYRTPKSGFSSDRIHALRIQRVISGKSCLFFNSRKSFQGAYLWQLRGLSMPHFRKNIPSGARHACIYCIITVYFK